MRPALSGRSPNTRASYPARGSSPRLANRRGLECSHIEDCNGPTPAVGRVVVSLCGREGAHLPGSDWGEEQGKGFAEEWEGRITLTADFADGTISGCVGCEGDLVSRRAHFGFFLGDELHDTRTSIADYELHLGAAPISPEGTISHPDVTVRNPTRDIAASQGHWGGALSNRPDKDGNPRLAAGFVRTTFAEGDDSAGVFFGAFVAPSEPAGGRTPRR